MASLRAPAATLRAVVLLGVLASLGSALLSESKGTPGTGESKYVLLRIWPKTEADLLLMQELYKVSSDLQFDFWKAPTAIGASVDIMVGPELVESTKKLLNEKQVEFMVTVDDVQKRIIEKETVHPVTDFGPLNPLLSSFFGKRAKDAPFATRNRAKYRFGEYHSYDEMLAWMDEIERQYPRMAKVFTIGHTHENRPIKGIKLGNPVESTTKRAVWIDGGIHAREWAAIHTALYFIEQLVAGYQFDPQITAYLDTLNFYVVPVANPDGFEYSRSDVTPQTRFWRKNRGNITCKKDRWHRDRCCGGVDLNRNFDFHFGETGSSSDTCSDIYQGTSAFSEPESRAIRDKLLSPELYGKVDAFVTLHTYSQMWIHPFNHERKAFPADIDDLQDIGLKGVAAIESMYGTKFRFGTGADILYPSAGGSDDWAKAKANIKYVYLLELRPGEEQWDGFLLDRKQLIPTGRETWEGVKVVIDAVMRKARPPAPTTPVPRWTTAQVTRPFHQFPQTQQQTTLRTALHDRLNALRQQQMQARRDYEKRIAAQQRETERRHQIEQLRQQQQMQRTRPPTRPQTPMCADRSRWCDSWINASPSICQTSTIYMRKDCAWSCNFC